MPATYRLGLARRLVNWLVRALLRVGLGPRRTHLLSVRGRVSARLPPPRVPVVEGGARRWLVAPYGEMGWVRNARAAGRVTLSRGGRSETVAIAEVEPDESALVLRRYVAAVPITRPFFDVTPESALDAFREEAPRHPVFRILGPAA